MDYHQRSKNLDESSQSYSYASQTKLTLLMNYVVLDVMKFLNWDCHKLYDVTTDTEPLWCG